MIVEYAVRNDIWSVLPARFPTAEGVSEADWLAGFRALYAGNFGEQDDEVVTALDTLATDARSQIWPEDAATLLFRPFTIPINAVVHLRLVPANDAEAREFLRTAMLPDIQLSLPPIVEPFDSPTLGQGMKGAYIAAETFADGNAAGGVSYVFASGGFVVNLITDATLPATIGLMEEQLDELATSLRLVEGDQSGTVRVA
jgi:hypothetical protein